MAAFWECQLTSIVKTSVGATYFKNHVLSCDWSVNRVFVGRELRCRQFFMFLVLLVHRVPPPPKRYTFKLKLATVFLRTINSKQVKLSNCHRCFGNFKLKGCTFCGHLVIHVCI